MKNLRNPFSKAKLDEVTYYSLTVTKAAEPCKYVS